MSRPWVVLKYGGTSVASVNTWGEIVKRVKVLTPTNRVWLVVSALSKVSAGVLMRASAVRCAASQSMIGMSGCKLARLTAQRRVQKKIR